MAKDTQIKFKYADNKLTVTDGDQVKVFLINDAVYGEIFRYVLKAIDQLDGDDPDPSSKELSFLTYQDDPSDPMIDLGGNTGSVELTRIDAFVKEVSGTETKYIWIHKNWDEQAQDFVLKVGYLAEEPGEGEPVIAEEINSSRYTVTEEAPSDYAEVCDFTFTLDEASVTQENVGITWSK